MPRPYHVDFVAGARKESPQLHAREIQKVDVVRRKGCLAAIDEHPTISSVALRSMEWTIEFIDGFVLTASEREMIYEKNARQILRSHWLGVLLTHVALFPGWVRSES
jgi:hypothetical protein